MSLNSKPTNRNNRQFLFFELFVAVALSVTYYFLIEYFAVGIANNSTNYMVFSSCSIPGFHLQALGDEWKGRLSGLLMSGWLFDFLVKDNSFQVEQYESLFGLYQSFWLFLLFLIITFALRHALFINLGIFAGLICNFTATGGFYVYPWDIPATFFFTLAIILFEHRRLSLMLATICVGCFFKETVLVCALLVLFATRWKWWSRLVSFAGMIAVYALGKKLLLAHLNFHVASFSMSNGTNLAGLLQHTVLIANLKMIFSFSMPHPIFTNAGTLAAVLLLGWRRRFLPYMTVILVSFAGLMVYGAFTETRDFMQLLPLSLILLSEFWPDYIRPDTAAHTPAISTPALAMRATFPVLIPITIAVIGLSTGIAARQYYKISENLSPGRPAPSETGKHVIEPKGHFNNLTVENQFLREEYAGAELELVSVCLNNQQLPDAIEHSRRLLELDTNSIPALNNLAWLLATTSDPQLRNGKEAVCLAERACQLTQYKEAYPVGTLAAAYAEAGRFDDAVAAAKKFRTVALAHGQDEIVAKNEQLLELLESGRAYHQEPQLIASDSELLRAAYAGDELELARASLGNQHTSDAIKHYQRLLELDTNSIPALNDLALLRATASDPHLRNGKEAVHLAEQACQLTQFNVPFLVGTLAAAYAEAGRFKEAVSTAEKARTLALAQGQKEIAAKNEQLLELYKTGRAYHQEAKPAP